MSGRFRLWGPVSGEDGSLQGEAEARGPLGTLVLGHVWPAAVWVSTQALRSAVQRPLRETPGPAASFLVFYFEIA